MIALEIKLVNKKKVKDEIGQNKMFEELIECPIIRHEDIYSKEYYEATQIGYKPSLRVIISSLNYDNQDEIEYMGERYSIIRKQIKYIDEIILICEKKVVDAQ